MTEGMAVRPYPFIAMPINRDFPLPTVHALLRSQNAAMNNGIDFIFHTYDGCSLVHKARNALTSDFLKTDCTHLFWIDSDLDWTPETFIKFCILSQKLDVIAGIYPKKADKAQFHLTPMENIIRPNEYGFIEIKRMAMGFSIVQRKVMEALAASKPTIKMDGQESEPVPYIFRLDELDGELRGEDMAFCDDIRELGFKIWLDPGAKIGHIGWKNFTHDIMDQWRPVNASDIQRPGPVAA